MLAGFLIGMLAALIWRFIQRTGFVKRRFAAVALSLGIAGVAGVILADDLNRIPYQYRSTATLHLTGGNREQVLALKDEVLSRQSLASVLSNPRLGLTATGQAMRFVC